MAEILSHHLPRERIVTRWHRGVRREYIRGRDYLQGRIKIELLFEDIKTNALEREKGGMAFVHVKNFRFNAKRAQDFHSANPEHDLLPHSHFEIAAIKLGRNEAVFGVVFGRVSVEEIKVAPGNAQFHDLGEHN